MKNGLPYLPETLAALEGQTMRGARIIAWDNGSTDATVAVLREWIPARIPGVVIADTSLGLGASLARMVERAETPLCARIDADDICTPERLARQVRFMEEHPNVVACGTQMTMIDAQGRSLGAYPRRPTRHSDLVLVSFFETPLSHPSVMFRRDAALRAGNYRDISPLEDADLWLRLAEVGELATIDEDLVAYRIHPRSVTSETRARAEETERRLTELLAEHASTLFGLSVEECHALRTRKYRFALPRLLATASHVARRNGASMISVLKSHWFVSRWIRAVRDEDVVTRGAIRTAMYLAAGSARRT